MHAHINTSITSLSLLGLNAFCGTAPTLFSLVSLGVGAGTKGHTGCWRSETSNPPLWPPRLWMKTTSFHYRHLHLSVCICGCGWGREKRWSLQIICVWLLANVSGFRFVILLYVCFSSIGFLPSPAICRCLSHDDPALKIFTTCTRCISRLMWFAQVGHVLGAASEMAWTNQICNI